MPSSELVLVLVAQHCSGARQRTALTRCVCRSVGGEVAPPALRCARDYLLARRAFAGWRTVCAPRPLRRIPTSWASRRRRTDDTPILVFR